MKNRNQYFGFSVLLIALLFLALFLGPGTDSVRGDCYQKDKRCYGIPIDDCIGFETQSLNFEDRSSCDFTEEIESECNSLKQELCGTELEENWSQNSYTRNLKCSKWISNYDLEVQKCN